MLQVFDLEPFYPTDRFDQIGKGSSENRTGKMRCAKLTSPSTPLRSRIWGMGRGAQDHNPMREGGFCL